MLTLCLGLCALLSSASAASGQNSPTLNVSGGLFDVADRRDVAEAGIEWRSRPRAWGLQINLGMMLNADSGGYAFLGARRDVPLSDHWDLSIGFAAGAYDEGDGLDLGGTLEFRSSIELLLDVARRARLGIGFYHLSNAGIYDTNPGSNSLVLVYGFRLKQAP